MFSNANDFIVALTRVLPDIPEIHRKTREYWAPDEPPDTILFAEFGRYVADRFDRLTEDERIEVFDLLERGMNSSDEMLATAVATGLIEAMLGRAYRINIWGEMKNYLVGSSKKHARFWMSP